MRVRYGKFTQFGRRIRLRTELPAERPRNCVNEIIGLISCGPNGTDPTAPRKRHHSDPIKRFSCHLCEKTRRSFVDGRDLTEINACKVRDSHHCGVTSEPSIRAELSGPEP